MVPPNETGHLPVPSFFGATVTRFLWLRCVAVIGVAAAAGASGDAVAVVVTHERATFLNFFDDPIPLFWVNPADRERDHRHVGDVQPYEPYVTNTFSGHEFVYDWKATGESFFVTVEQLNEEAVDADDADLKSQVHVLGSPIEDPSFDIIKRVVCDTTKGEMRLNVLPFWAPLGAARFLELVHARYFDRCALNRVVPKFLTQFGIGAAYDQRTKLRSKVIPDDPARDDIKFAPGFLSYAGSGPDSRSAEVFVVMPDTPQGQLNFFGTNSWETPFGYVLPEDLGVVGSFRSYGDMAPWGEGPDPQRIYERDGYEYLAREFPELDYVKGCAIVPDGLVKDDEFLRTAGYKEVAHAAYGEDYEGEL